ncbi:hypothetical protein EG328_003522 [Venturia inaequalis]|uniref:Uncharacterized protein n=1 Tax=Venturia inaequalis TaxID=5025 RepID=A0A8H3USJ0_VENIN|nr:hypothetical protein EG328_003522 [Venturia inaequalis]KAE9991863.1 hypothetical protein EG327_010741 [Venturia inaequalis]
MSAPQLPSSTSCSETSSGYAADRSASGSSSEAPAVVYDGSGDSGSETSSSLPSSDGDRSDPGHNILNGNGSVHGPDVEAEAEEDSGYEAEEGWRPESSSGDGNSSSQKSVSVEGLGSSSGPSASSEEEGLGDTMAGDSPAAVRGVKRDREDDAGGSSKRARAA